MFAAFKDQYVVFGQNTSLPCDINSSSHSDPITLILWYKRDISGWSSLFQLDIIHALQIINFHICKLNQYKSHSTIS